MEKTKKVKERKTPSPAFAVISFVVIIAVLVLLINLQVDTTMSVFAAALIAAVIAFILNISWAETEKTLLRVVSDCIPTFLIVIMVGMLVGHLDGRRHGPALMYYGMKLISPKILVPLAFVLCFLCAEFTGHFLRQRGHHGPGHGGRGLHHRHPPASGHRRHRLRCLVRRQDVPSVRHHQPGLRCQPCAAV